MQSKALTQGVGVNGEDLIQIIKRESPGFNAVIVQQNRIRHRMRTGAEFGKPVGRLKGIPALRFGIAPRGCGRADTSYIHKRDLIRGEKLSHLYREDENGSRNVLLSSQLLLLLN